MSSFCDVSISVNNHVRYFGILALLFKDYIQYVSQYF